MKTETNREESSPKLEIFGSEVLTQIRPVWVGDLGTRPKNPKLGWFRPENRQFVLFSAVGYKTKNTIFKLNKNSF
jgi:hypothetical protein